MDGGAMERAIGRSLRALTQLAGSPLMEKLGLSASVEKALYRGTKASVGAVAQAMKRARPMVKVLEPLRMKPNEDGEKPSGFDLTLTESQALMCDTMARFARASMR